MRVTCWISKATDAQSEHVIRTAVPLQQWLHETASMPRYTYTPCPFTLVLFGREWSNLRHDQIYRC
jgi:hypothetical protein